MIAQFQTSRCNRSGTQKRVNLILETWDLWWRFHGNRCLAVSSASSDDLSAPHVRGVTTYSRGIRWPDPPSRGIRWLTGLTPPSSRTPPTEMLRAPSEVSRSVSSGSGPGTATMRGAQIVGSAALRDAFPAMQH